MIYRDPMNATDVRFGSFATSHQWLNVAGRLPVPQVRLELLAKQPIDRITATATE